MSDTSTALCEVKGRQVGFDGFSLWAVPGTPECAHFDSIESAIAELPQVEFPVVHRFTPGMYIRETTLPKNTMLTTHIHITKHPYVISKGDVTVSASDGMVRLQAPFTGITQPGTRRIIYAHEETIWTTFHATDETDVDKIKAAIFLEHWDHLEKPDNENEFPRVILTE